MSFPTNTSLPTCREALTQKNIVNSLEFYVTVGFYDGSVERQLVPGEVIITVAKEGSTLGGLCQSLAVALSVGLHYGVPWEEFRKHLIHHKFEPNGYSEITKKDYSSLVEAIAHSVDLILERRKRQVFSQQPNVGSHAQQRPVQADHSDGV